MRVTMCRMRQQIAANAETYKRLDHNDYWAGDRRDPRTYNLFQGRHPSGARWRTSHAEHLIAM